MNKTHRQETGSQERRTCAQPGCERTIPLCWGDRPFCTNRECTDKQRDNPMFWAYHEQQLLREVATSRRCSRAYYRRARVQLLEWNRKLEEIALLRIEQDRKFIDELRSKGDELAQLIEAQERDARTFRVGHRGQKSLQEYIGDNLRLEDLLDQDGDLVERHESWVTK